MARTKLSRSSTLTRSLLSEIFLGLEGAHSLHLSNEIRKESREGDVSIISMEPPDPNGYDDWRAFFSDWCVFNLGSKLDCLNLGIDRSKVAVDKFLQCEEHCRQMNVKFRHPEVDPLKGRPELSIFLMAREKIRRALGHFDWGEAVPLAAFGPGAAVGVSRKSCHVMNKFGLERPTVTGECATIAEAFIKSSPQWSSTVFGSPENPKGGLSIVRGSRVTTVPKSAKTDRVIAVEPLMNMFFQKGIGAVIRRRLKSVGVNLDDQTRNQMLARKGSITGELATIDLASASDSISRGLVEWLLPDDWVTAMKHCRSVWCTLPSGEEKFLQKFSSMGNGFTFELESLIFWAFCSSCCTTMDVSAHDLGVYGDDLVVPSAVSGLVVGVLSEAGFETNKEKTFTVGPFRESCGKHYFRGHDVTPLFVRKDVEDPERLLWLANSVRRLAHRKVGLDYGCCAQLRGAYDRIIRSIPHHLRKLSIPEGFGDGGLVRDFDESHPKRHRCYDAYITRHVRRVYSTFRPAEQRALTTLLFFLERRKRPLMDARLLKGQLSVEVGDVCPFEIPTKRYRLRVVKLEVSEWYGLGPWLDGFNIQSQD